jgi:hypothetical protein
MRIKPVQCRMRVGHQQRGGVFTEHLNPDDAEACRAAAAELIAERGLPPRAVLEIKVNGRWIPYRPA